MDRSLITSTDGQTTPAETTNSEDRNRTILRVVSYHRRSFDVAVASVNPAEHEGIRDLLLRPCPTPASSLGDLDILPPEIQREINLVLDIASLFTFRHVNRRASRVVSAIRPYREVAQHGLDAVCAMLRADAAPHFTISDLESILHTKNCLLCGSFGGFVFLPCLTRCCFSCVEFAPELRVLTQTDLRRYLATTLKQISKRVPILQSIPGSYSQEEKMRKRSARLLSEKQVANALEIQTRAHPGSPEKRLFYAILRLLRSLTWIVPQASFSSVSPVPVAKWR